MGEERSWQEIPLESLNDSYLSEEGTAKTWAWGESPSDCYEYWPVCRWLLRRPTPEQLKKSSKRKVNGTAGKRLMHRVWEEHYRMFLYGRRAKMRHPYRMAAIQRDQCTLTPEDLEDVKQMMEEIEQYKLEQQQRASGRAPEDYRA